jgi:hypothetical protein
MSLDDEAHMNEDRFAVDTAIFDLLYLCSSVFICGKKQL